MASAESETTRKLTDDYAKARVRFQASLRRGRASTPKLAARERASKSVRTHAHIAIRLAMALTWCESRSLLLVLFSMLPRLEA